jgi:hypothetical protein
MADADRRARAEARRTRVTLRKSQLRSREDDLCPIHGPEAVSLVYRLTRESWSLSGLPEPDYSRRDTPWRFVPDGSR